jgi:hypothetical protein
MAAAEEEEEANPRGAGSGLSLRMGRWDERERARGGGGGKNEIKQLETNGSGWVVRACACARCVNPRARDVSRGRHGSGGNEKVYYFLLFSSFSAKSNSSEFYTYPTFRN